ncbi:multisubunit Na+/H+ antiporter MnhB subunit [Anoxybacillus voinovskiensis]|uniref:Multisubunit Na+/H+ antiporter MnhB subunit n=1 Tax=Anoxybacteroides voinovskiense TaxID=230470 RepID=A0A840DVA7_9BACL|nr:hypothetical protein [Anoxybacillus voinovskiensis]MBB4073006.1 multisubunit Na+/H+ antiporter MnhB subunit [Anoxybacillus voinovskiensis]GGJ60173.1 hypothetical protein GCM10008982_06600 [Anoxybacillus voinovskiensis]
MNTAGVLFGSIVVVVLIFLLELPRFRRAEKKEKTVFLVLLALGMALAVVLIYFPDVPGPTQLVHYIFEPLARVFKLE